MPRLIFKPKPDVIMPYVLVIHFIQMLTDSLPLVRTLDRKGQKPILQ